MVERFEGIQISILVMLPHVLSFPETDYKFDKYVLNMVRKAKIKYGNEIFEVAFKLKNPNIMMS
jgi:Fe-S cluster assembly iron-binding protein IscA